MDLLPHSYPGALIATIALTVLSSATPSAVFGQSRRTENVLRLDDPANRPAASIDQIAWLAGAWAGEGFGGMLEETWNPPSGGTMVGLFKLLHDDDPSIYEIQLITETGNSLEWRVKHFNPDFSGWEDKGDFVSFPLVQISDSVAYFDGLTVKRDGDDRLIIHLTVSHGGALSEERLVYQRVE